MAKQFRIDSLGEHPTLFTASDEGIVFEEGDVVAGRFEVISAIGGGGMGLVYKVKDTLMEGEVKALKVILPSLVRSEKAQQRFAQEARIAQKLAHQNIVNTYDLGEYQGIRFITMECLEGESLTEKLDREKTLPLDETLNIMREVLNGLVFAHRTTVHRDIKPQNIFLCEDGTIKILDFGLARIIGSQRFTQSSAAVGTAAYMAPEQLKGEETTAQCDLYSLGVVFYPCLVGEVPLGRFKLPGELGVEIPQTMDDLLNDLLDPNPERRPPDISALLDQLNPSSAVQELILTKITEPKPPEETTAPDETTAPRSTGGRPKVTGKYQYLWRNQLDLILDSLRDPNMIPPIRLDPAEFDRVGDRKSYSFNLEFEGGQVSNNISGSAVARDLASELKA